MPRYIDADLLVKEVEKETNQDGSYGYIDTKSIVDLINDAPTANVMEVKHGKWTEKDVMYIKDAKDAIDAWQSCRCSVCGRYHTQPYMYFFSEPRFCSYCGAEMRKETEDAEIH